MNHLSHVYCCNGPLLNLRMPFTNEIVCFRYFIQHLNVSKTLRTYSVHRYHFSEIIFLGLILGKDLVRGCLPPLSPPHGTTPHRRLSNWSRPRCSTYIPHTPLFHATTTIYKSSSQFMQHNIHLFFCNILGPGSTLSAIMHYEWLAAKKWGQNPFYCLPRL